MAFIFARYAHELFDPLFFKGTPWGTTGTLVYAGVSVLVLSFINILGVRKGKWTQNILTVTKVLGLVGILVVALAVPSETPIREYTATESSLPLSVAMIMILFTFGGWNEMAYVAAEMKNPQRNTLRTILVGTCAVTVLYLLINGAFLFSLGHGGLAGSGAVAVDTIKTYFSQYGQPIISALICISALGAINGLIFAGARISYALGSEHRLFHYLGHWNRRTETPVWSLGVQAVIALLLIIVLGSFKLTILFTAAAVYSFYLATNIAVIVLRKKEPQVVRPYKVTGYPLTPLLFAAVCGYLIYSAQAYAWHEYNKINAPWLSLIPLALLLLGLPIYWLTSAFKTPREKL